MKTASGTPPATPLSTAIARALKLVVPPHSACLANEERQGFYKLLDNLIAKYRPADEAEQLIVREIADFQWKANRNKQLETAIYNRELMRQAPRTPGTMPELRDLEIAVAAQEALTGNKTIAELRKDTQVCLMAIARLQRRLKDMQKTWPAAAPVPPTFERDDKELDAPAQETASERTDRKFDVNGPVTPNVISLYRDIFRNSGLELVGREVAKPEAA